MSALARVADGLCYLLGDLHARWELALEALRRGEVCDGEGRWCAPAGTTLLQVGDLIDRGWTSSDRSTTPAEDDAAGAEAGLETIRVFMRLQAEAAAAGSEVICLMGNHELDLLRGRFDYMPGQKAQLLAKLGMSEGAVAAHGASGLPLADVTAAAPELRWLADLPFLALAGEVLAVHGGPTSDLIESLDVLGIDDLEGFARYLEAARAGPDAFDHPAFTEGRSVFSPDRPADDAATRPRLAGRFLALAGEGVTTLAVGHSPFLHFPKGRWQDLGDAAIRARVDRPGFVGHRGRVLKLDTNLKRGGKAWLVWRDPSSGAFTALAHDGERAPLLRGGTPWEAPHASVAAEGVDADQLDRTHGAIEAVQDADVAGRLGAALGRLLYLGLTDLSPVEGAALHANEPEGSAHLERLEALVREAGTRLEALKAEATACAARGEDRFDPAPSELVVQGRPMHLAPVAAREAGAALEAVRYVEHGPRYERIEAPMRRPATVTKPETPEATEATEAERPGKIAPGPALEPGPQAEALAAWAARNASVLDDMEPALHHALIRGQAIPGRYVVVTGDGGQSLVITAPDGTLLPANTAFTDPAARYGVADGLDHATWLLDHLPGDPVALHSAVKGDVEWILRAGEVGALGLPESRGPRWRRGRYLFTSPHPGLLDYFFHKGRLVTFRVPREALSSALEAGLLNVSLFLSDRGEALDPDARLGAPDIGIEMVALGEAGVRWLCRWLEPS